jgi:hypothetical protein
LRSWLPRVLTRIRALSHARQVFFTLKARRELTTLDLGLDQEDACDLLARLKAEDSAGRLASASTGEWMYVFKPSLGGLILNVKVILRSNCIVVSFHESEGGGHGKEDE